MSAPKHHESFKRALAFVFLQAPVFCKSVFLSKIDGCHNSVLELREGGSRGRARPCGPRRAHGASLPAMPPKKKKQAKQKQLQDDESDSADEAGKTCSSKSDKADKTSSSNADESDKTHSSKATEDDSTDSAESEISFSYRNDECHIVVKQEWQQQRGAKTSFVIVCCH